MENKALPSDLRTGWLVLAGCRWISLAIVPVILLAGSQVDAQPRTIWLLLLLSSAYTAVLTLSRNRLPLLFATSYAPIAFDVIFCMTLLVFSGAWDSPFYLYSLSPVLLAAFFRGGWPAAGVGLFSMVAYIAAIEMGGRSFILLLKDSGIGQLTSTVAYLLVSVFFSYPSGFLRQLETKNQELSRAKESLAEANKSLESVNRQLVSVQTINAVLQSYLDLPRVIESILDGIKYGLDFDRVILGLFDEKRNKINRWRIVGGDGRGRQEKWDFFELPVLPDSPTGRMFAANRLILLGAPASPENVDSDLAHLVNAGSGAIIPLVAKSRPIGLIIVDNGISGRPIAPEDMTWLDLLATHAAIALNNAQLYSKAQELAAVTERNRIAMEIHDGLSQTLSGARLILSSCNRILPASLDSVRVKLSYLDKMLARSYEEMRYAIYNLRLPFLSVDSLTAFFRQHVQEFSEFSGIKSNIVISGSEDTAVLSEDVRLCLCRVLQESLNNAHKHSGATSLTVFFSFLKDEVTLEIVDNGRGFIVADALEQAKSGKTFGIVTTENRVSQLRGNFTIESRPDVGTSVKATMPGSVAVEINLDKSASR